METEYLSIPDDYRRLHHFVTLMADIMFINEVPFLITQSRKIRLYTIGHVPTRTAKQLGSSVKKIVNLYARHGFTVNVILMDSEFKKIVEEVPLWKSIQQLFGNM